jgi:NAD+ synthase (glutamine-hydrolysing)
LDEIALGWYTVGGDQECYYNVNCGIPKELVIYVVGYVRDTDKNKTVKKVLKDIILTPISPELKRHKGGEIVQRTENLVGPYELQGFNNYHFQRWCSRPAKIAYLGMVAWGHKYSDEEIFKWLELFIRRDFMSEWKNHSNPDGPKVGSVARGPRSDWRVPSDADPTIWLQDLANFKELCA